MHTSFLLNLLLLLLVVVTRKEKEKDEAQRHHTYHNRVIMNVGSLIRLSRHTELVLILIILILIITIISYLETGKRRRRKKERKKRNKRKLVKRKKTLLIWWCPISRSISVYKIEIENAIIITISFVVSDCVCVIQRKRRDSGSRDAWRRNCCREKTDDPCSEQREQRLPPSLPPSSLFRARC